MLNLGDPEAAWNTSDSDVLRLLDVVFDKSMPVNEKKALIENDFSIPMTRKMDDNMDTMNDTRYGFEIEAEKNLLFRQVTDGVLTSVPAARYAQMLVDQFIKELCTYEAKQTAVSSV